MHKRVEVLLLAVAVASALVFGLAAQGTAPEAALVSRAAEALGGRDRVMTLKTLQIVGYGRSVHGTVGTGQRPPNTFTGGSSAGFCQSASNHFSQFLAHGRL